MPISTDPEKRAKQIANLKRGDNPAPVGNQLGLKHGASKPDKLLVRERRTQFLAELSETFPSASNAERLMVATNMARLELLGDYLDQHGVIRNRRTGQVYEAARLEQQVSGSLERQWAILTAREQARPANGQPQSLEAYVAELTAEGAS